MKMTGSVLIAKDGIFPRKLSVLTENAKSLKKMSKYIN